MDFDTLFAKTPATLEEIKARVYYALERHPLCRGVEFDIGIGRIDFRTIESVEFYAVVEDDAIAIRSMMYLCLSFDHRILDGAGAGGFLQAVRTKVQNYGREIDVY